VAYSADTSGQFNLWTQPVSGGPVRQLTSFTGQSVRSAAWSPDGTLIAFTADTGGDEQTQVFTVAAAGGPAPMMSGAADRQFMIAEKAAFDPSGRYLLCGGNDQDPSNPGLIVYDLRGGPQIRFAGPRPAITFPVALSPDGRHAVAGTLPPTLTSSAAWPTCTTRAKQSS